MNKEDFGAVKNLYENIINEAPLRDEPLWDGPGDKPSSIPAPKPGTTARPRTPSPALRVRDRFPATNSLGGVNPDAKATYTSPTATSSSPTKITPAKPGMSSPTNATTAQKIAGGMKVYDSQRKAGDMKGATETGKNISSLKFGSPEERTAKTIGTRNPLMDKTFGYQTGNAPDQQKTRADAIINSGKVAAIKPQPEVQAKSNLSGGNYSTAATSMMSQRTKNILGTKMQNQSYEWPSAKTIKDLANAYSSIYEAKKKDQDQDGDNDFADVRIARMIASGVPKEVAIAKVKGKPYNEEFELDEATAMAKRGHDETAIRNKIAKSTGGGKSADRATELENRPTYGQRGVNTTARKNLARAQRGDFRKTTSSNPGLHGYAHKSDDPAVQALQAARGRQRGVLTPRERTQLNREAYEAYEFVASYLLENNFASRIEDANVIINNMSEGWFNQIMEG